MLPFGLSATVGAKQVELFANTLGVRLGCGRKGHLGFHGESSVWGLVTVDSHLCGGENSIHGKNGRKSNFSSSTEEEDGLTKQKKVKILRYKMEVQTVIPAAIFYHVCLRLIPHINCTANGKEVAWKGGGGGGGN